MSRSGRASGAGGKSSSNSSKSNTHLELDEQQHVIDMSGSGGGAATGTATAAPSKRGGGSKKQSRSSRAASADADDPYETPPPTSVSASSSSSHSTAGDPLYDLFAVLERKITEGSTTLKHVLQILKQIKQHPHYAQQLKEELEEKLEEAGAAIDEISLMHKRFNSLSSSNSSASGVKFSSAEKSKRKELREHMTADIEQMTRNYTQIRAAAMQHVQGSAALGGGGATPGGAARSDDERDDDAHQSLLSGGGGGLNGLGGGSSSGAGSSGALLSYQSVEYLGPDLEGHLSMLESSARQRAEFMKQIESDVVQVHALFQDVNYMVNAQQLMVDAIDANIEETHENAKAGMEQLLQAQQYQRAKRKKMCCLALIAVVALFVFFLFLWVLVGGN